MREWFNGDEIEVGATEQAFKVKMTAGTASIQMQAIDEGYDEIDGGGFTATGSGVLTTTNSKLKIVLGGDARFFMGLSNNRT